MGCERKKYACEMGEGTEAVLASYSGRCCGGEEREAVASSCTCEEGGGGVFSFVRGTEALRYPISNSTSFDRGDAVGEESEGDVTREEAARATEWYRARRTTGTSTASSGPMQSATSTTPQASCARVLERAASAESRRPKPPPHTRSSRSPCGGVPPNAFATPFPCASSSSSSFSVKVICRSPLRREAIERADRGSDAEEEEEEGPTRWGKHKTYALCGLGCMVTCHA